MLKTLGAKVKTFLADHALYVAGAAVIFFVVAVFSNAARSQELCRGPLQDAAEIDEAFGAAAQAFVLIDADAQAFVLNTAGGPASALPFEVTEIASVVLYLLATDVPQVLVGVYGVLPESCRIGSGRFDPKFVEPFIPTSVVPMHDMRSRFEMRGA